MERLMTPVLCSCGCGQETKLASRSSSRFGWVKGQPLRFLMGHMGGRPTVNDGLTTTQRFHWKHREERRKYAKAYYDANRAIVAAAKNVPCKMCGQRFPDVCMDFHHRDPADKSFGVGSKVMSCGPTKLAKEISKCDVYCANCHRIMEHSDRRAKRKRKD